MADDEAHISGDVNGGGFVDLAWDQLSSLVSGKVEKRFERFLKQRGVSKWIIATDFCIGDDSRPNDTFAFVVFPAGDHLTETMERISRIPPRDLKDVRRKPSSKLLHLITKGKVFSFCFFADKDRRLYPNADAARKSLDNTIAMMERWENADDCRETIGRVKAMRTEAQKKSLNLKLLTNIVTCSYLISFIASQISKSSHAELLGWVPDRDSITEAYSGIAAAMFNVNYAALSERMKFKQAKLGIFEQKTGELWCDPYIRVADFVAGSAAAWDMSKGTAVTKKAIPVISAFADNPYFVAFKLDFRLVDDRVRINFGRIKISHRPF